MFFTCAFRNENWDFVNKYNESKNTSVLPETDAYSIPSPSCGHWEYCSPSLSKSDSSGRFLSFLGSEVLSSLGSLHSSYWLGHPQRK